VRWTPISAGRKSMTTLRSFLRKTQKIPIFQEGSVIDLSARIRDFAVSKIDTDKRRNCTWQGGFRWKCDFVFWGIKIWVSQYGLPEEIDRWQFHREGNMDVNRTPLFFGSPAWVTTGHFRWWRRRNSRRRCSGTLPGTRPTTDHSPCRNLSLPAAAFWVAIWSNGGCSGIRWYADDSACKRAA